MAVLAYDVHYCRWTDSRANTIFMTTYFIGGSLGTFLAGQGWSAMGWTGVCIVGGLFAFASLLITLLTSRINIELKVII